MDVFSAFFEIYEIYICFVLLFIGFVFHRSDLKFHSKKMLFAISKQ